MSGYAYDDRDAPGYFLPEDSRFRLVKLSDFIQFLVRVVQPRTADEERDRAPEVPLGELAFCLELLGEQVDLVLDEVSWPARRTERRNQAEREAVDEGDDEDSGDKDEKENDGEEAPEALEMPSDPGVPEVDLRDFTYGLKLEQIDRLNLLLSTISAHADVVVASSMADFAENTLSAVGDTIFEAAAEVREILEDVNEQRLWYGDRPRFGVSEGRAVYAVPRAEPSYGKPLH